jgi:hypothetical protein
MAQDAARVPAWRRLGLALKNQEHAGVAVPGLDTPSNASQPPVSSTEPEVNGQASKLGKRKHQHEPLEQHHQETKKSRVAIIEPQINQNTPHDPPETVPEKAPEKASATGKPAKGDSNYRKKKEKSNKRPKAIPDAQHADPQPHTKPSRASPLSPEMPAPATVTERPALLASTETNGTDTIATPQKSLKKSIRKDPSASPRKSVAFTPDTKKSDGNSGQDYFKAWVASQKGTGEVSQPPEVSNFVLHALIADEEKTARKNGQLEKKQEGEETKQADKPLSQPAQTGKATSRPDESKPSTGQATPQSAPTVKGKKKDPSIYIAYLTQYYNDRSNWKFNKAKQNDVVDNALNIFRIPVEHSEALSAYIAGLQGAGVIERLRERCRATLKDLDEQDAKMDDAEARKVAQEDAEQERITKERARRQTDGDVAAFAEHPHSPGFIRRLQRRRAEALLNALGRTAPVMTTPGSSINPLMKHVNVEPPKSIARKRKRRTDVSSDESSDDSSDDSSDSDSDSDSGSDSDSDDSEESASSSDSSDNDSSSDSESD